MNSGIRVPFKRLSSTACDRRIRVTELHVVKLETVNLVLVSRSFSCYDREIRVGDFQPISAFVV